jgi:hypothetical protein
MTLYDAKRLTFVVLTMVISLAGSIVSALIDGGWLSATILNVVVDLLIIWYIVTNRDVFLGKLLVMGIVGGIIELLFSDPWAVNGGTLVYERGGIFIIDSPLYMPLGWAYVLLQIGYLSWWVLQQRGVVASVLVATILGGTNIPTYEALARSAHWWYYQHVPMIVGAPYYVILGEAFIGLALPFIVKPLAVRGFGWSVVLGMALGGWTYVSAIIAYRLVGS